MYAKIMENASKMIPIMSVPCNMVSFMILSLVFLYAICAMKINAYPNRNASSCAKKALVMHCHIKIDATRMAVETIMYHAMAFCAIFFWGTFCFHIVGEGPKYFSYSS